MTHFNIVLKCVIFMMILVVFFSIYKNREVARCFHGYHNYATRSDITRYQNLCTIPSSSRICIQISLAYPALPNWHFQILPLYYLECLRACTTASSSLRAVQYCCSVPSSDLLAQAMTHSSPSCTWDNTAPVPTSMASVSRYHCPSSLGNPRMGALVRASFSSLNAM